MKYRLGELIESVSKTYDLKNKKSVTFVNTGDVFDGSISGNETKIKDLPGQAKKSIELNDILFSEIRPKNKRFALVTGIDPKNYVVSTKLMVLRNKNNLVLDTNYLYFYLTSPLMLAYFQSEAESRSGTFPQITFRENVANIKIDLPPLIEQRKIVQRLSVVNDKVKLNNQINDNLLDFLDTEFSHQFLGERNFPSGKVKNFITIKRGASPRPIKDFLSENGRSWVKISDVTKLTTPFLYRTEQYIKESGIKKSRTIKPGTLILSNSATPGIPVISEILASVHDGWLIIDNYSLMDRNWFYLFFRQMRNSLVAQANGSVFNNLKTNIVKEFPVPIVDKSELTKFHKISNPIFEKLNQIQQENIELNRIKQTLLSQYF